MRPSLAYLLERHALSETFIQREIAELRKRGWQVGVRYVHGSFNNLHLSWSTGKGSTNWRLLCGFLQRLCYCNGGLRRRLSLVRNLPKAVDLTRRLSQNPPLLIHAHFAGITADIAGITAYALQLPWTCSVHAYDVFTPTPPQLKGRLYGVASVTACSHLAGKAVLTASIPPSKLKIIHHGLDITAYPFEMLRNTGVIFTACRLEPKKGLDTLLQACALLHEQGETLHCVIAGEGSQYTHLQKLAEELHINSLVTFTGWLEPIALRTRMMEASLLALPSRSLHTGDRDGIANVILEAMASGIPVITTAAGAASEIIENGVNGILVEPDSPQALAEAMRPFLVPQPHHMPMIQAARQTIEQHFDIQQNIGLLEQFFLAAQSPG